MPNQKTDHITSAFEELFNSAVQTGETHTKRNKNCSPFLSCSMRLAGGLCRKMMNHQYLLCGDQLYVKFTGIRIKKTYIMKLNKIKHFYKKSENLSFLPIDYKRPAS